MSYIALVLGLVGYVALIMLIARASGIGHRLDTANDDDATRPLTQAEIYRRARRHQDQPPECGE